MRNRGLTSLGLKKPAYRRIDRAFNHAHAVIAVDIFQQTVNRYQNYHSQRRKDHENQTAQ
jgi:hypothetical protein